MTIYLYDMSDTSLALYCICATGEFFDHPWSLEIHKTITEDWKMFFRYWIPPNSSHCLRIHRCIFSHGSTYDTSSCNGSTQTVFSNGFVLELGCFCAPSVSLLQVNTPGINVVRTSEYIGCNSLYGIPVIPKVGISQLSTKYVYVPK